MSRPPLKDRAIVRDVRIELLATKAQRERWMQAASKQGITLSKWARLVLDRAARTG